MEPFRFSHYPMSGARRKGKRQLSPEEKNCQDDIKTEPRQHDNAGGALPMAKRLKVAHGGTATTTTTTTLFSPPRTPLRPKRDFHDAFAAEESIVMTPPPSQRARVVCESQQCQSAGQVTTETPSPKPNDKRQSYLYASYNNNGMNGFLGQLHAERKQRQESALHPSSCPLTQSMHAMSIHHAAAAATALPPQQQTTTRPHRIQLHTDSKLA